MLLVLISLMGFLMFWTIASLFQKSIARILFLSQRKNVCARLKIFTLLACVMFSIISLPRCYLIDFELFWILWSVSSIMHSSLIGRSMTMSSLPRRLFTLFPGKLLLKLDINKPFDRVEWPFLEAIIVKIGFQAFLLLLLCLVYP